MAGIFNENATVEIVKPSDNDTEEKSTRLQHSISEIVDCDGFALPPDLRLYTNGLLELATPLLSVLLSIPRQDKPMDLKSFRLQLRDLLHDFKIRSITYDYHPSVVEKSTYVLCVAIDEAIAYTKWGKEGGWVNHSLLSSMFTQRNGGEIFFVLLDKACQQPKLLIDFIELVYILLLLGFKGKFSDTDQNELSEIKAYVYKLIEHYYKDSKVSLLEPEPVKVAVQPFIGLNYKFLFYYICIALLAIFLVAQIKFHNDHQQLHNFFTSITTTVTEKVSNAEKSLHEERMRVDVTPAQQTTTTSSSATKARRVNRTRKSYRVDQFPDPNASLRTGSSQRNSQQ